MFLIMYVCVIASYLPFAVDCHEMFIFAVVGQKFWNTF